MSAIKRPTIRQKRCGIREARAKNRKLYSEADVKIDRSSVTLKAIERRFAEIDKLFNAALGQLEMGKGLL